MNVIRIPCARSFLLCIALVTGCATSSQVAMEIAPVPARSERSYADFWQAALALDFERAEGLATDGVQRRYAQALRRVADGRLAEAQDLLVTLLASVETSSRAQPLLAAIAKEAPSIAPQAYPSRVDLSFAEALHETRARERWSFPPGPAILPFERKQTPTPLISVGVNGLRAVVGIDTGAGLTVIGSELADAAGARRLGARIAARDAHGAAVQVELAIVDLDLGAIRIERHPVIVMDSARLRFKVAGVPIAGFDGLLGWNAIRELRMTLDNSAGTLALERTAGSPARDGDLIWIGEPYVRARASNGLPLTLFLDTGAAQSAIAEALASEAGLSQAGTRSSLVMGAGSSRHIEFRVFRDAALHAGGARLAFAELRGAPSRALGYVLRDGVLGADALTHGRVTIDFGAREFTIR